MPSKTLVIPASPQIRIPSIYYFFDSQAQKCVGIALRVLVTLTLDNQDWSQSLIRHKLIMPFLMRTIVSSHHKQSASLASTDDIKSRPPLEDSPDLQQFDRFCLALGLLTNLVQGSADAQEQCRETCEQLHILPFAPR
jgi:hypothetical protein